MILALKVILPGESLIANNNGPFVDARHMVIRDTLHGKAKIVYSESETEPKLQPVGEEDLPRGVNTQEGARADIRVKSYLRRFKNAYFDVQVINAQSKCLENITSKEAMKRAEENKQRLYKQRIESVEGGPFITLIFTTKGARSYKTAKTISKIEAMIANKRKKNTGETIRKIS